ncbi:hypothetical protein R1sor_019662 [Riccia sorocarpa]|uniref:Uncharacterized protein n=1 Tax=Riccia sorocarpa TaxID=122646 RepID=A0ABD3ID57_9MARC
MDEIVGREAISIGSFPELRYLGLKCWALADVEKVFRYSIALESLELELQEAVPDVFGHLKNLRDFRLKCSGLENNLANSWGELTTLEYLLLSATDHTSELKITLDLQADQRSLEITLKGQLGPPGIFEPLPVFLTRVEKFILVCEHGYTTTVARNMINLKHLAITVQSQQPVQDSFGRLRNLRKFKLVCSGAENSLVESLRNMTNLEVLVIAAHSQQQPVQDIFGHLQRLRKFKLLCGRVENNLMGSLHKLTSLEQLHLSSKHESAELGIKNGTFRVRQGAKFPDDNDWFLYLAGLHPLKIRLKGQHAESSILEALPVYLWKIDRLDLKCEHGAQTALVRNMINLESFQIVVEGPGAVPDVFGALQKLREFTLSCHAVMDSLERSFVALSSLELLELKCTKIERLPHAFGCFSTLEHLWISCPSLRALPLTVGNFVRLRTLRIFFTGLQSLPDSIGQLSQLEQLSVFGCNHLQTLPESLGQLSRLITLKVYSVWTTMVFMLFLL